jgi:Coenzyme PQQ synthesis protein D (PqqD)
MTNPHDAQLDPAGVDWRRLAEPQEDQYDTAVALQFLRDAGFQRARVGDSASSFDGQVIIDHEPFPAFPPSCVPAPLDHPYIEEACNLIRLWPTVFTQFQGLIDHVSLWIDEDLLRSGSTDEPGRIAATINNPVSLAEGLVHEMSHQKLRAIGIQVESASRIIVNKDGHIYKSPVRYDCLRPMTAILHAEYALLYIVGLYNVILRSSSVSEENRQFAARVLASYVPMLEFGDEIIREHAEVDDAGRSFLQGYREWLDRLSGECYDILDDYHVPVQTFKHPLDIGADTALPIGQASAGTRAAGATGGPRGQAADPASARPCRERGLKEYFVVDELLLYCPESEKGYSLNKTAKAIWRLCDGRHTLTEISEALWNRLDCTDKELLPELISDVEETLAKLQELGLVRWEGSLGLAESGRP